MKKLILYGAGKRGRKIAELLNEEHIYIEGFLDSNKTEGEIECQESGKKYKILSLNSIKKKKSDYQVIITIADFREANKIKKLLNGLEIVTIEDVLINTSDNIIENNRQYIAEYHNIAMEDYYQNAESKDILDIFWNQDSIFYGMFLELDLDNIIELACGRGRHVEKYMHNASKITLVDILDKNIMYCKRRFLNEAKISYYVNNGHDLSELESGKYSALFTYDSMVHFEMIDIFEYLRETERVLKRGGKALFHHSNNTEDYRVTFSTGTRGRNYMSAQLFAHLVNRAGLRVIKQEIIDWEQVKSLDCITLVEKV